MPCTRSLTDEPDVSTRLPAFQKGHLDHLSPSFVGRRAPSAFTDRVWFALMLTRAARLTWLVIGVLALALGALGVVLPLLPTTPLVLVAAFAFARSSERLHQWLLDHDVFGALIDNWRRYGAISRRAKVVSVVSMVAILGISLVAAVPAYVIGIQVVVLGAAATFILSRPLPPGD